MTEAQDILLRLASLLALVAANGFFVAAEFALVTIRKTRVDELVSAGNRSARVVQTAIHDLDRFIAGTQVGITIASIALGWIGEPALAALITALFSEWNIEVPPTALHTISVGIAFTIITFLHVILGELVPKSLALQKPEATALFVARPMTLTVALFRPLIWSLNGLGNKLLEVMGLSAAAGHESIHSARELELLVRQSHKAGVLDDLERSLLQRTFRFSDTTVGEIMVPRSEMAALDLNHPIEDLLDIIVNTTHTRLPVFHGNIDRIDGLIYVHDLFRLMRRTKQSVRDFRSIIRTPLFVPESLHLDGLIEKFRLNKMQIAIVVDEYGGTAGIITLEDIFESVFGEFPDMNDHTTPPISMREDGVIVVRGDTRLVDLNEAFGWQLEEESIETIGGYVMARLGRIPKVGDVARADRRQYKVAAMEGKRILEVVISPSQRPSTSI